MWLYVEKCFADYCNFSGRASRKEYWYFFLFNTIISNFLGILYAFAFSVRSYVLLFIFFCLAIVYTLVVLLPSIAVSVRRLHDTGKSATWLFIVLIPLVGFIWLLMFMLEPGMEGDNRYGIDPKTLSIEDEI